MLDFSKVLEIFVEKDIIPTVISVAGAITTLLATADNNVAKVRLGRTLFFILAFCIYFLIIQFTIKCFKSIRSRYYKAKNLKYRNKQIEKSNKDELELLWSYVDQLFEDDYQRLIAFLQEENAPIIMEGEFCGLCLLNSEFVHSSVVQESKAKDSAVGRDENLKMSITLPFMQYTPVKKQYVLKQDFYDILRYSKEKYSKISHFR